MSRAVGSNAGKYLSLEDEKDKVSFRCVQAAGILALVFSAVMAVVYFVALGNEVATEDLHIYAIFMLVLCPTCAVSSFMATKKLNRVFALFYALCSFSVLVVTFSIMVADLVTPGCTGDVIVVYECIDDQHQPIMLMVAFDCVVLAVMGSFFYAGVIVVGRVRIINAHVRMSTKEAHFTVRDNDSDDEDRISVEIGGVV